MILLFRIEWAPFMTPVSEKLHCRQPGSPYVLAELPAEWMYMIVSVYLINVINVCASVRHIACTDRLLWSRRILNRDTDRTVSHRNHSKADCRVLQQFY